MSGPDRAFYDSAPPLTAARIAELVGAVLVGVDGDRFVTHVADLAAADVDGLAHCTSARFLAPLKASAAGACLMSAEFAESAPAGCVVLIHPHPAAAFACIAGRLHRPRRQGAGPAIHPDADIAADVEFGPGAVVGPGARLAQGCRVGANASIGPGVCIGRDSEIGPGARIGFAVLGQRVRVHANAVIGEAGFGVVAGSGGLVDLPQLGRVIIGDDVTIGSATCIDRGALGDTAIGRGTKIDNLVQIAHNVVIGRDCVLAAHTGISGSVTVGDRCMFGGRAGVADHLTIGPGARIAAASGLMNDVPAGESWAGVPAKPVRRWFREVATLAKLSARRAGEGRESG